LSIGQPDFDVPDPIKAEAISAIQNGYNNYTVTSGMSELKEALLLKLERDKKKTFEDILITSGVSGGLFLAFLCLVDPGDEVLIPDPYFVSYKHLVNFVGGKPVFIDTYPDFRLSKEKLRAAISPKTKLLVLNSPANPTGKTYSKNELLDIVEVAQEHDLFILSDEIYDVFTYDGEYESVVSLYDRVLLLGGFSKTLGITGWRIGYAAGDRAVIQEMVKLQQYTFVCAPSVAQKALIEHLDYDMSAEIESYRRKRDMVVAELDSSFGLEPGGGAFYLFPAVPHGTDESFVEELISHNVLTIPGSVFSERHSHFRISFATSDDRLREGIAILNRLSMKKS